MKIGLTIVVRASGEATLPVLSQQLKQQLMEVDVLEVIDNDDCFEVKMVQGFKTALNYNNPYTVFIDADILIRKGLLNKIRKLSLSLREKDLGFGIRLWDRFYDQPKFRGLHIYQTQHVDLALKYIPEEGVALRPESKMKNCLKDLGYNWRNDLSAYIGGVHDYGQHLSDIYYKFLIRSKRASDEELLFLKNLFKRNSANNEFKVANVAIIKAKDKQIKNDKKIYENEFPSNLDNAKGYIPRNIESYLISKTLKRYSLTKRFINSNF